MRIVKKIAFMAVMVTPFLSWAAELEFSEFRLTIGPFFRNFDEIEFKGSELANFNNATQAGGPFGVQGFVSPVNLPNGPVTVDYMRASAADDSPDTGDSWGPMIGFEMMMVDNIDSIVNLVGNFQFFSVQVNENSSTDGFSLNHQVINTTILPVSQNQLDNNKLPLSGSGVVDNDFDLELYVFDLGVKTSFEMFDPFSFSVTAGPSLSIGDLDTEVSTTANVQGTTGTQTVSSRSNKSDVDIIFGLYFALEGAYRLSETFSLGLGYRYDWSNQEAATSQASLDLATHGGYAKFIVDF